MGLLGSGFLLVDLLAVSAGVWWDPCCSCSILSVLQRVSSYPVAIGKVGSPRNKDKVESCIKLSCHVSQWVLFHLLQDPIPLCFQFGCESKQPPNNRVIHTADLHRLLGAKYPPPTWRSSRSNSLATATASGSWSGRAPRAPFLGPALWSTEEPSTLRWSPQTGG